MRHTCTSLLLLVLVSCLFARCGGGPDDPYESAGCELESFSIRAGQRTIKADIDHHRSAVTIRMTEWLESAGAIVPQFSASGTVTVNGIEQESGASAVDFHTTGGSVVYTVISDTGQSREYTVTIDSPMFSGLPTISIDVDGGREITQKTVYTGARITIDNPGDPRQRISSEVGIRGRGNSSWLKPKKPWRIHFADPTAVLGLDPARNWVLLANWQDPTLIMNEVAFEMGRRFGIPYTNNSRFVELWINGTYRGNYQLTEQIQAGTGRVAIDEDNGGFLAELDTYYDGEPKFRTSIFNLPIMVKDPETASVVNVEPVFEALETALRSGTWQDCADEDSFIDYMLVTEIVRNPELSHPKSLFIYRYDASSKLCFGPLWDFDWSFAYAADGSFDYFRPKDLAVLYGPHRSETTKGIGFLNAFYTDSQFRARYRTRWNEMMDAGHIKGIIPFIEELSQSLMRSQRYNFERWPNGKDYAQQIGLMKAWLSARIEMLDREINKF